MLSPYESGDMRMTLLERRLHALRFQLRQARVVAKAMKSRRHPIVAHIVPIRRCNLACTYCNEYDAFSQPVPLVTMLRRIDRLAELGTTVITISGVILSSLIVGVVLVEVAFSLPGLGSLLVTAATAKDIPVMQGVVLLFAVVIVIANLLADVVYMLVDPRIRVGSRST